MLQFRPSACLFNEEKMTICLETFRLNAVKTLHCAKHAHQQQSGLHYADSKPIQPATLGKNSELATELWRRSEEWVRQG
jgi:hypothetical protein